MLNIGEIEGIPHAYKSKVVIQPGIIRMQNVSEENASILLHSLPPICVQRGAKKFKHV